MSYDQFVAIFPDLRTIRDARRLLVEYLPITRMLPVRSLSERGRAVHLKLETELPTGSFKPRGALYALTANLARRRVEEVTASSTGNHGAAVAFAAKTLGIPATIFLPQRPAPSSLTRSTVAAVWFLWLRVPISPTM